MDLEGAYLDSGILINSAEFDGTSNEEAKGRIAEALEKKKRGSKTIQYRLRDWGISRQRYWGSPIPIIYCDDCGVVLVPEKDLPVELPTDIKFTSGGGNPLAQSEEFKNVPCPKCGKKAMRETDTMDTFV